mmetsp:Transcript_15737/g.44935  ORF Transcript_15737/g.44935 Transcript_15737/m.44935 type:complete len:322 (-) Transcript_15737:189-1154(-)
MPAHMEFQAYPTPPRGGKAGGLRMLWQTQGKLHGSDSVVLPALLLFAAVGMATYQHMTSQHDKTIRNFLVMIILSMLPLAFLEKRLLACVDPVGLLFKFSPKVLLMQASFLTIRMASSLFVQHGGPGWASARSGATLATACALLPTVFGFRLSRACFWEHRDVWGLAAAALLAAVCTEIMEVFLKEGLLTLFWRSPWYRTRYYELMLVAASDYTEILAFVPAMWMVCRADTGANVKEVDVAEARRRSLALFVFMLIFYVHEDLYSAYVVMGQSRLASLAHVVHFLLVSDFAAFILAHLYDPDKHDMLMKKLHGLIADRALV